MAEGLLKIVVQAVYAVLLRGGEGTQSTPPLQQLPQALADGCFGLALGLPLHLGLPPFVTGSGAAVKILTEDMKELTGGQVIINPDAKESADILEKIILEKRDALHI